MDREKVIGSLQEAAAYFRSSFDAMYGTVACEKFREWTDAIEQAHALLKAQEPVEPKIVDTSNSKLYHNDMFKNYYCGNCGEFLHVVNRKDLFCSQCGRAVKWND